MISSKNYFYKRENKSIMLSNNKVESIVRACKRSEIMYETAHFEMYKDGAIIYHHYKNNGDIHEICVINDTNTFEREENINHLLGLDNTIYLSYRVFRKRDPIDENSYVQVGEFLEFDLEKTKDFLDLQHIIMNN